MILKFINRLPELNMLDKRYKSPSAEFFIIYGRRRIGKTELIKKFAKDKNHFYFLAKKEKISLEIERFREKFARKFNIYLKKVDNLETIFRQILEKIDLRQKFIFIIDEFPFWISKYRPIVSEFQYLWDELLKENNIFLILLGSSVSMMEHEVLSYRSPLYGRRTGQLKLQPFRFVTLRDFLPNYKLEDLCKVYGATGGYHSTFKNLIVN